MNKSLLLAAVAAAACAPHLYAQAQSCSGKGCSNYDRAGAVFPGLPAKCDAPDEISPVTANAWEIGPGFWCDESALAAFTANTVVTNADPYLTYISTLPSAGTYKEFTAPVIPFTSNLLTVASLRTGDIAGLQEAQVTLISDIVEFELDAIRQSTITSASYPNSPSAWSSTHNDDQVKQMASNVVSYNGCLNVLRGVKTIGYFEKPANGESLFDTCTSTTLIKDTVTLDFTNLGLDVVTGLCHLVRSFITDSSQTGKNLVINFDYNYLGEEANLRLGAYSAFLSPIPTYVSPSKGNSFSTPDNANVDTNLCVNIEAWVDAANPATSVNRVMLSLEHNHFGVASTYEEEDGDAFIGQGYLSPPIDAAQKNGQFGQVNMCNNTKMKRLIFQNDDQQVASSGNEAGLFFPSTTAVFEAEYSLDTNYQPNKAPKIWPATPSTKWGGSSTTGKGLCKQRVAEGYKEPGLTVFLSFGYAIFALGCAVRTAKHAGAGGTGSTGNANKFEMMKY